MALEGKVVVVTGATAAQGLGSSVARIFAAQGARVVGNGRRKERGVEVEREIRAAGGDFTFVQGDVQRVDDCHRLIETALDRHGRIDVLINNAGGLVARTRIEDYTEQFLHQVIALNVIQVAMFMHEVIPIMRKQKKGNVINVSSIAARHGGGAGAIMYAGAKGFISTATHGWAKEVAGDGIRVNAISPGVITTPFHERYTTAEQLKAMQATIPMNRLGTADECAGTLIYLASDELSGYVTGQVIEVNGGQYMP